MSFSVYFTARNIHEARHKLKEAQAPAAVKAVIELALCGALPAAKPLNIIGAEEAKAQSVGASAGASGRASQAQSPHGLFGLKVEAHGHIADVGDGGRSWVDKIVVEALVD
jgi:hypothetical protein